VQRAERVVTRYMAWRKKHKLPCQYVENAACRQDLIRWRDYRLDHEAGRKTVANDLATLSSWFEWCVGERFLTENPVRRITRPRFVTKKEGTPLTRPQAGRWLRRDRRRGRSAGRSFTSTTGWRGMRFQPSPRCWSRDEIARHHDGLP
jgi:site-specific recombinase XerD